MKEILNKTIYSEKLNLLILFLLSMSLIFSRSFLGLYLFNFRIGEYLIAFSLLLFIGTLIAFVRSDLFMKFPKETKFILYSFFIYFFINALLSNSSFFDPYTYKTSSYIWTLSFIFLGINAKQIKLNKNYVWILEVFIVLIYFSNILGYPNFLVDFFLNYSDKYEPHKGSDLALFFMIGSLLISKNLNYSENAFQLTVLNCSLYLPLFLYKSRAAFIGVIILMIYEFYTYLTLREIKVFSLKNLILFIFSFLLITYSTFQSQTKVIPEEVSLEMITDSYSSLGKYKFQHFQDEYPLIYFKNGRVYSGDGNLNWRLDMWQDEFDFVKESGRIFSGIGYNEKFKVFLVPTWNDGTNNRLGYDRLNESLHNYFVTVFLRGGVVHLLLLLYFYYVFISLALINKDKRFLVFTFAVIFISSFDNSMENSHFPLIYFYFFGNYFFNNHNNPKNKEKKKLNSN
tara:strand:- start:1031 stop:2398 length:1368 start_codon:yes stop_codon:yes gene_type:complete